MPASVTKRYLEALQPSLHAGDSLRTWASRYVRLMLGRCNNNKRRACDVLGISYHTLQAYLRFGTHAGRSTTLRLAGKGNGDTPPEA